MARLSDEFLAKEKASPVVETRYVVNPPLKKVVREGGVLKTYLVHPPQSEDLADWCDVRELTAAGPLSAFGRFLRGNGVDLNAWAEGRVVVDEGDVDVPKTIFQEETPGVDKRAARVVRNPYTRAPENVAVTDYLEGEEAFFGEDKPDELAQARKRIRRVKYKVKGGPSRARPIKMYR